MTSASQEQNAPAVCPASCGCMGRLGERSVVQVAPPSLERHRNAEPSETLGLVEPPAGEATKRVPSGWMAMLGSPPPASGMGTGSAKAGACRTTAGAAG